MSENDPGKPRLDLPRREEWGLAAAPRRGWRGTLVLGGLLAAVIALQVYSMVRGPAAPAPAGPTPDSGGSSDLPLRDIAARLQRNNLPLAAAQVQEELLRSLPRENREERLRVLRSLAGLLIKARRHEEALVRLYQAEGLHPDAETRQWIDEQVTECLRRLGKHDEVAYELGDRSSPARPAGTGAGPGGEAADREVARIGVEVIRAADLDAAIAEEIDRRIDAIPGLPDEEREKYRARLLEELRSPQRRLQKLQEIVARRVLFRAGMERELDRDPAVRNELEAYEESLVARQVVLDAMRERVRVSESDLRNFFLAEGQRYVEGARAHVRLALLETEERAAELLAAAASEDDFARVASEHSTEAATRAAGGLVEAPVVDGEPFPLLGEEPALTAAVLAAEAGRPIAKPVETARGWAIAFVREKTPPRTPTFEEARERVAQDYVRRKELEVQQGLMEELFRKYAVTIHTEAFIKLPAAEEQQEKSP